MATIWHRSTEFGTLIDIAEILPSDKSKEDYSSITYDRLRTTSPRPSSPSGSDDRSENPGVRYVSRGGFAVSASGDRDTSPARHEG